MGPRQPTAYVHKPYVATFPSCVGFEQITPSLEGHFPHPTNESDNLLVQGSLRCDVCLPRGTAGPVTPSLPSCGSLYPQCPWNMESMLLGVGVGLCRQRREQAANGTKDYGPERGQGLERDPRPGNLAGLSQPCGQAAKSTHDTLRPGQPVLFLPAASAGDGPSSSSVIPERG